MELQDQRTNGLSDAQNIAKNLIENIVNDVVKYISVRTGCCSKSLGQLKLETCANEEMSDCFVLKNDIMEKHKSIKETVILSPDVSDRFHQNTADSTERFIHPSSSKPGEGDYPAAKIGDTEAFHYMGLDSNQSCHNRTQYLKNNSNLPLNTESSHDELMENLYLSINNMSFDNIHLSESETDDMTNDTHFSSVKPTSYNTLEMNDCETCEFETKKGENVVVMWQSSSKESMIVERDADTFNSDKYFCENNPFKNPLLSTCDPLISTVASHYTLDPTMQSKNPGRGQNKVNVFADIEQLNNIPNWEESFEMQVNTQDLDVASKTEDIKEDFIIQNRKYWSNVGLISEDKINRRYVGPTDSLGIESIKGMSTVEECFLDSGNEKRYLVNKSLQSWNDDQSAHLSQCNYKDKLNYLSYSKKPEEERKKKKFMSRFTKTISKLFKPRKKNEIHK